MSQKEQYHLENNTEDAHIIHLKHQVKINFDENYDYYLKSPVKRFFSKIFVYCAIYLFKLIHKIFFGLKVKNKKIVKQLLKQKIAFITIANHCHILDSTMCIATTSPKTVYMPTVEPTMKIPFVRHILRAGNVMPIPFNMKGLLKFKKDCNELLQNNKTLHYFPEGALWPYYGKLREFKPGAFRFAVEANCPIIPYCIYYRQRKGIQKMFGKMPLMTLEILPPIYANTELGKKQSIDDLMNRSHQAMAEIINAHPYDNPKYHNIEQSLQKASNNSTTSTNVQQ